MLSIWLFLENQNYRKQKILWSKNGIYFTENLKIVFDLYMSPGISITDGKFSWLGESG